MTFKNIYLPLVAVLLAACNPPKTLYLSNKTSLTLTLFVEADTAFASHTQKAVFKDSLHGRRIEPGHSIINFGAGDWNKNDLESLKTVLEKTNLQMDGKAGNYRLPRPVQVAHYRLFVEELLVRLRKVEENPQ